MSSGREYRHNGHTIRLGPYAIDRITPDGTLHAGCHVINWPEITRIAPDLDGEVDKTELILMESAT